MPTGHGDRLSATDASFLSQEGPGSHMHVGGLVVFEGPVPSTQDFVEHLRSRLHLVPRYRQRLAFPPLESGRPIWVDDRDFNLEYHLRHTALPTPGGDAQLQQLVARIMSQQLDRHKPLWELWLIEGLADGGWALISKNHHSLIDGIAGVDLATVLFDLSPDPPTAAQQAWRPAPTPSSLELLGDGLTERAKQPFEAARAVASAMRRPGSTTRYLTDVAEGLGEVGWAAVNPAPTTPLNVPIGPHRRFDWARFGLADFKLIKDALGGTINDVVLAATTGALRRFLRHRGVRTEGLELRALVPVSIRSEAERDELGNRIAVFRGPLPVYASDPVERLRIVRESMDHIKHSKMALGAETITTMNDFMPPTLLAQASRINFSTRLFNLIVTNVPGPQIPLYVLGRQVCDVFPVAFLPENHALAVAIMSYHGTINYGLIADYDQVQDLGFLTNALKESVEELLLAAGAGSPRRP